MLIVNRYRHQRNCHALQRRELVGKDTGIGAYEAELVVEFVHYQLEERPVDPEELEEVAGWNKLCDVEPELDRQANHKLVTPR
jgi:hypothetical protein